MGGTEKYWVFYKTGFRTAELYADEDGKLPPGTFREHVLPLVMGLAAEREDLGQEVDLGEAKRAAHAGFVYGAQMKGSSFLAGEGGKWGDSVRTGYDQYMQDKWCDKCGKRKKW